MFCHSWSGTNPPPFSLFLHLFPPLRVFMVCRYQSKTNLPPSFSSRSGSSLFLAPSSLPLTLPPSFPLWLPLLPVTPSCYSLPQTITVYLPLSPLPPHHGTLLLLSTGKLILTAKPLEKRLRWKPPPCMWCSPKQLTRIDFIWHFVSKSCTRRKKMYHVMMFIHLSNRRLWQCSRNKIFTQTYMHCIQSAFRHTLTSHSYTALSPDNTDTQSRQPHTQILMYLYWKRHCNFCCISKSMRRVVAERAWGCQLSLHSSSTNVYISCSRIITELSEPFSGPRLQTAYEKTPIKQLSLEAEPNSVIWAPKKHWEGDHSGWQLIQKVGLKALRLRKKCRGLVIMLRSEELQ